jgi:hypothetical protein
VFQHCYKPHRGSLPLGESSKLFLRHLQVRIRL